jgi:hypothetical protein
VPRACHAAAIAPKLPSTLHLPPVVSVPQEHDCGCPAAEAAHALPARAAAETLKGPCNSQQVKSWYAGSSINQIEHAAAAAAVLPLPSPPTPPSVSITHLPALSRRLGCGFARAARCAASAAFLAAKSARCSTSPPPCRCLQPRPGDRMSGQCITMHAALRAPLRAPGAGNWSPSAARSPQLHNPARRVGVL